VKLSWGKYKASQYEAWAIGAAAGLVDATASGLHPFVPHAIPFTMTIYALGGAVGFEILRLLLDRFLGRERSIRSALGIEAALFALLLLVFGVTTSGSGFLASSWGQKIGLLLAVPGAALIGGVIAWSWRARPVPLAFRVGLALALLIWPAMAAIEGIRGASDEGRGLILVSLDAARGDRISALGYPRPTTPNIDGLVESGLSFTNAVVQCPASGPGHATMLTGLPPLAHQVLHNADVLDSAVITVAERLIASGFSTAGFTNNFYIDGRYGFAQGFQTWVNQYRATSVATWHPHHLLRTTTAYQVFHRLTRAPGAKNRDSLQGALHWLERKPAGDFFLFLHLMDPHAPYDAPLEIRDRFYVPRGPRIEDTVELRARLEDAAEDEIAALRDLYDASIALGDQKVGSLVDRLENLGLLDNTLIVITADHGEVLDENGPVFDHGLPGQGNLHVPLVLGGGLAPGAPGQRIAATVTTTSWVATAFEVLGLDYVEQGTQAPVGPLPMHPDAVRPVYGLTGVTDLDRSYALDGTLKLLLAPGGIDGCFDLATDPLERENLCAAGLDDSMRQRLMALEDGLLTWRETTTAAGIVAGRRTDENFDADTREQLKALGYIE
jgi:arylsulfatase